MGGLNSCFIPRNQNPNLCRENHTSTPKTKGHRRNLSAAFNLADLGVEMAVEKLNINTATEEEFMTLPGINRSTAQNIVDYRRQIGGFKKVEDLALVSGVGATKLNQIRVEITVGKKKGSQSSSRSSSRNDLSMQDSVSRSSGKSHQRTLSGYMPKMNVNVCNVFQLMRVHGISQTIAENIVAYRDKKGLYKSLDDLVRVKGVTPGMLSAIRPYLILQDEPVTDEVVNESKHRHTNGSVPHSSHTRTQSYTNGIMLTNSPALQHLMGSQDDLLNIYGPIARSSMRYKRTPPSFKKNNQPVVRLASWNLQQYSSQKASNPGVKEVTAMTILENGFGIVAVQELADTEALSKICDELNKPTIPNVKRWSGQRGFWKSVISRIANTPQGSDHLGFLYDASQDLEIHTSSVINTLHNNNAQLPWKPFFAIFKTKEEEIVVVNVHVPNSHQMAPANLAISVSDILQSLEQHLQDHSAKNIVIMGDFGSSLTAEACEQMESHGYHRVSVGSDLPPEGAMGGLPTTRTAYGHHSDQIWMGRHCSLLNTGDTGVVTEGLTSPWIPNGWQWGGSVSDHAPLWAELYVSPPAENNKAPLVNGLHMLKLAMPIVGSGEA